VNIESKGEKKKITFKWGLYIIPAFFGNGFCSIFQNMHVRKFEGAHSNEFMVAALMVSAIVLFIISLFTEKKDLPSNLKKGAFWYSLCGLSNGGVNLLVIVLTQRQMAPSVMFPVISAGGIVISFIISLVLYKEKFSIMQYIGLILGIASIVLLNL
jgi:multidrug transporter EmrE-like cation transporter